MFADTETEGPTNESRRAVNPRPCRIDQDAVARAAAARGEVKARVSEESANWYALIVQPGQHDTVAAHLAGRGFGVCIPMQRGVWTDRGIKPCQPSPLMGSYVLVWVRPEDLPRVRSVPGAVDIMTSVAGVPAIISDADVWRCRSVESDLDQEVAWHLEKVTVGAPVALTKDLGHVVERTRQKKRRRRPRKSKRARLTE
jgi:hypothetical protein